MKSKNYPILNFNSLQMYNKNGNIGASVPDNKQLSRLLRIKVLFLLAAIGLSGSVAAQTSSPNARISLDLQNVPLKEVFARIEDQRTRFSSITTASSTLRAGYRSASRTNPSGMCSKCSSQERKTHGNSPDGRSSSARPQRRAKPKSRARCASWVRSRTQTANR